MDRIHSLEEMNHGLSGVLQKLALSAALPADLRSEVEETLSKVGSAFQSIDRFRVE